MTLRAVALTAIVAGTACVAYSGGARAIDPTRLATEPGWVVAASTPMIHQPGAHDCGAAALAMVAGRWHVALSVDAAVAALPVVTAAGSQLGELRAVARARGMTAFAIVGDQDTLVHELRAGRPAIVGLVLPYGASHVAHHYEVVVAVRPAAGVFVTIDPVTGWRSRTWAELDAEWSPAGRPMLVVTGLERPNEVAATVRRAARAGSPR